MPGPSVSPPRLQPLADEVQHGPIIAAHPQPVPPPRVVHLVAAALASGLHPLALSSVLPSAGQVADRLQRAATGALAVTALQHIRRIECRQPLRPGQGHPCSCARRDSSWPFLTVGLGKGTASDPCGPGALGLQALCPCRHGGLRVRGRLLRRAVIDPTGSDRVQVLPAGAEQVRRQAPSPLPPPVGLVRACWVGEPPQGGWRMWDRSARVRQTFPGRAAACRPVLPHVVGVPHRCGLGVIRHPIRLRRAFPGTGLRRLPVPWAPVARRFQQWSGSGLPLRGLRSWRPAAQVCHGQERLGLPTFCDRSRPACHGLRTPAALLNLATSVALLWPAGAFTPSASAMAMAKLSQPCRGRGHPGGLQESLSTRRPSCSPRGQLRLRQGRKTRYGWVARPDPPGTFTLPETPSFSWRDNARPQAPPMAGAKQRLLAVACRPWFGWACLTGLGSGTAFALVVCACWASLALAEERWTRAQV
jgi:hypothetical protein